MLSDAFAPSRTLTGIVEPSARHEIALFNARRRMQMHPAQERKRAEQDESAELASLATLDELTQELYGLHVAIQRRSRGQPRLGRQRVERAEVVEQRRGQRHVGVEHPREAVDRRARNERAEDKRRSVAILPRRLAPAGYEHPFGSISPSIPMGEKTRQGFGELALNSTIVKKRVGDRRRFVNLVWTSRVEGGRRDRTIPVPIGTSTQVSTVACTSRGEPD